MSDDQRAVGEGPGPTNLPIRFVGTGTEYFGIWIVNLLLIIVTLSLYYPWARERRLKYFAANTEVDGHPLTFHGRGKQMFVGFFIAVTALVLYSVSQELLPVASLALLALYALIWPWLFRAANRFRLSKTTWRGLNFGFAGSLGDVYKAIGIPTLIYLVVAGVLFLLAPDMPDETSPLTSEQNQFFAFAGGVSVLLLVLLAPYAYYLFKRYQHNNFAYASLRTQFSARPAGFYWLYLVTALLSLGLILAIILLAMLLFALVAGVSVFALPEEITNIENFGVPLLIAGALLLYGSFFLISTVVTTVFQSRLFNLIWNNTSGKGFAFSADLRFSRLLKVKLLNILLIILTMGLYIPFAKVALARVKLEALHLDSTLDIDSVIADVQSGRVSATMDSAADVMDIDIGI